MKQDTKLTDLILTIDNVLPKQHCEKMIEQFEKEKEQWEEKRTVGYKFDQLNINKTPGWEPIVEYLTDVSIKAFDQYFNHINYRDPPKIQALEEIRIKKYENEERYFDYHVDVADYNSARRYLVGFIYLDDNEEGKTVFPDFDIEISPVAGRMLIFPPLWMYPHAGMPPKDKPKYIIGTYAHYV
jgi:hypothetical protein